MAIAAAAVGAIIAGAGSYASSKSAQDAAARGYRTRYQTQVKDLKKAGLNPMLSLGMPAPVPQVPQSHDVGASMTRGASEGFSAAQQARMNKEQIEAIRADVLLKSAQAANATASAQGVQLDNAIKAPIAAQSAMSAELSMEKQHADAATALHAAQTSGLDVVLKSREVEMGRLTIEQQQALQRVEIAYKTHMAEQARLGVSAAKADSQFWETAEDKGKWLQFLKQMIK